MAEAVLRVVQLNIGSLLEPGWDERRHEIVAWLSELDPDVVCLQEVWEDDNAPNTAGWLADALRKVEADATGSADAAEPERGWYWRFGGRPFGERLWPGSTLAFGSAVLSRWPIDQVTYHALPVDESDADDPFVTDVPWELLHVRTAGLDLFSCHLASAPRDGLHRRRQVVAIDAAITAATTGGRATPGKRREGMPPILCGDFNAEPDSDEVRFLAGLTPLDGRTTFYQDAWRVAGDGSPGHTQDWRTNPTAAALNVHRKRIDYVWVGDPFQRQGSAGRVLSARLAFHEARTGVLASDHAGLVVEVVWPDRPA